MVYFPINYKEYISSKNKQTILFLHGWGCSSEIFKDYVEELKNKYNLYLIDFYGFGQSIDPEPFFDTYEYALQLYLFLKSKNIDEISIFAHSFGGRVAIILSSVFNIKINKMVLTGCAGLKPRRSLLYYLKVITYKIKKKLFKKNRREKGSVDYKACKNSLKPVFVRVVNQHLNYLLSYIKTPTFLIWGNKDKETPKYMLFKLHKGIKCSKAEILEDGTHFCAFTHIYLIKNKVVEFFYDRQNCNSL